MLDDYKEKQNIIYKILKQSIEQNRTSHAYLFETNGYKDAKEVAFAFAKALFCPHKYTNNQNCKNCSQCQNISQNNFIELKVIEPDGMWIKKEQLDELQKEFSLKSIASNKKIYIINHADKLNSSSANTILKFLEEPSENIIAILIADNLYQVLQTIQSRCQILSFRREKNNEEMDFSRRVSFYITVPENVSSENKIEEKVEVIKNFVKALETKKKDTILYTQRLWHESISGKEMNIFAFEILTYFYRDALALKMHMNPFLFQEESVSEIAQKNEIIQMNQKLRIINTAKENIKYNANIPLLLDKLIIELSDVE